MQEKSYWNTERRERRLNVTQKSLFHPNWQHYIDLNKYWFNSEDFKYSASEHCLSHFSLIWSPGKSPSLQSKIRLTFKWEEQQWADKSRNMAQRQDSEQGCTSGSWWWLQYSCNASCNTLSSVTTQVLSRHTQTKPPVLHLVWNHKKWWPRVLMSLHNKQFLYSVHSSKMEQ